MHTFCTFANRNDLLLPWYFWYNSCKAAIIQIILRLYHERHKTAAMGRKNARRCGIIELQGSYYTNYFKIIPRAAQNGCCGQEKCLPLWYNRAARQRLSNDFTMIPRAAQNGCYGQEKCLPLWYNETWKNIIPTARETPGILRYPAHFPLFLWPAAMRYAISGRPQITDSNGETL